ncbi:unnamed protein product [Parnassius apollo]|uniref:(apollo) hypothetical protein n=1 Tax=Parnassius apollo TaxID=110799 RepID=A0A8S3XQ37_PARAO|nr:unnamed protein product [Parnassius apollo]
MESLNRNMATVVIKLDLASSDGKCDTHVLIHTIFNIHFVYKLTEFSFYGHSQRLLCLKEFVVPKSVAL